MNISTFSIVTTPRHYFTDLPMEALKNTTKHETTAAQTFFHTIVHNAAITCEDSDIIHGKTQNVFSFLLQKTERQDERWQMKIKMAVSHSHGVRALNEPKRWWWEGQESALPTV